MDELEMIKAELFSRIVENNIAIPSFIPGAEFLAEVDPDIYFLQTQVIQQKIVDLSSIEEVAFFIKKYIFHIDYLIQPSIITLLESFLNNETWAYYGILLNGNYPNYEANTETIVFLGNSSATLKRNNKVEKCKLFLFGKSNVHISEYFPEIDITMRNDSYARLVSRGKTSVLCKDASTLLAYVKAYSNGNISGHDNSKLCIYTENHSYLELSTHHNCVCELRIGGGITKCFNYDNCKLDMKYEPDFDADMHIGGDCAICIDMEAGIVFTNESIKHKTFEEISKWEE